MTRRLLDKKTVKISFSESPDNQEDYNYSFDLNLSSDEDIFLKGKSEVLWTRARDLFDSQDSYESFSDFTGRTLSSCSWHNDEFDMKSTSKVNASLEAIDNALYEKVKSPFMNDVVFQECCDWSEKFPYLRLKGEQVITSNNNNFVSNSSSTLNTHPFETGSSTSGLQLEGKKLPIHATSKSKGMSSSHISDNKGLSCFEEIIGDEEEFEEYLAVHKSEQPGDSMEVPINDNSKNLSAIKLLQDKVLNKLVSEMWPSVVAFIEKLGNKSLNNINEDLQLPPISITNEQKRALCLKRPKTEGSSMISTEFPKLENILTVSPKILQKRELGCNSRVARPSSEMSVNVRMSSKSVYHHSSLNNAQLNFECSSSKNSRINRESESLCLVLPALEEDFQDSSSVLRGFHIEPGKKDLSNKSLLSSKDEYGVPKASRENEYFLPPIEDKNYVQSNMKLTKNLFTFYGSPVLYDKNKYSGSAKYKKTSSRPNTSASKKSIKSHDITRHLTVNSGLYKTTKNVIKVSNSSNEKNLDVSVVDDESAEDNQEKSVTLFPIVTPLTPHEDKNTSVKKGLLHTFLGGKKR